jgi:hypothetical protein
VETAAHGWRRPHTMPPDHAPRGTGRAMAETVDLWLRSVQRIVLTAHPLQPHRIRPLEHLRNLSFAPAGRYRWPYCPIRRRVPGVVAR